MIYNTHHILEGECSILCGSHTFELASQVIFVIPPNLKNTKRGQVPEEEKKMAFPLNE
jgi:hypothetical protein